jgi:transcriptional regulator with XRE-family HTH domain
LSESIPLGDLVEFVKHEIKNGNLDPMAIIRPGLFDMADVINHRSKTSPGTEARDVPTRRPITEALLSAIAESGLSSHALGMASGVYPHSIREFRRGVGGLSFASAVKLMGVFGIGLVPASNATSDDPPRPIADVVRSAIEECGLNNWELARASGLDVSTISRFRQGERGSNSLLGTVDKLIGVVGLAVVREAKAPWRVPKRPHPTLAPPLPFAVPLRSAIEESGHSNFELTKRSGLGNTTIRRFRRGEINLTYITAMKLANAVGFDPGPISAPPGSASIKDISIDQEATFSQASPSAPNDHPREPGPWDDWDASVCPVQVGPDGRLVVFGRDKGRLKSRKAIELISHLVGRYPGGFDLPGMRHRKLPVDSRGILNRLKAKDADCMAAFQFPMVKGGDLYRIGPPAD